MSRFRTALLGCSFALVASFALARVHPFGDAGLYAAQGAVTPILNNSEVPSEVRAILVEKCADCHSNQTHAPAYGHFAPASWLMERDIVEARKAMNLSQWDSYSAYQRQTLAAKMLHETRSQEMPPVQYRMIHWNARIVEADLTVLGHWSQGVNAMQAGTTSAGEGDPARGKDLFEKRCVGCHGLTKNGQGPKLQGVYGRTSGAVTDYAYSDVLKKANVVWDETTLDKWLTDPDAFLSGNNMDFLVSKPQERKDLISYLRQVSGK